MLLGWARPGHSRSVVVRQLRHGVAAAVVKWRSSDGTTKNQPAKIQKFENKYNKILKKLKSYRRFMVKKFLKHIEF
jgi:hypothetical protein